MEGKIQIPPTKIEVMAVWAGRAYRHMIELSILAVVLMVCIFMVWDPRVLGLAIAIIGLPTCLSMLLADRLGRDGKFWTAWHEEDKRLGLRSPINALDHFVVAPFDRYRKSKNLHFQRPRLPLTPGISAVGTTITHCTGRQSGRRRTHGGGGQTKKASDDPDGGDGEPPRPRRPRSPHSPTTPLRHSLTHSLINAGGAL
ncbi:hypothetical protein [Acidithiobacillus sp.]